MTSPNLFDYATKELSQDAMICWLIDWADRETNGDPEDEKLRQCGLAFVKALFSKWEDWGYSVDLGASVRTVVSRQEQRIDVLASVECVDGRHVLLIEDKTNTGTHDNQLERSLSSVLNGKTCFENVTGDRLWPIYCRTGNHSLKDRQHAEKQNYAVFDRTDFLGVLETYQGRNEILIDFRRHLRRWQEETDSFSRWESDADGRTKRGWEGFYRYIEENCLANSEDDWWPLGSLVGGYNGLSIEPAEIGRGSKFAIWIEEDRISFRLYGAENDISKEGMERRKHYWANAFDRSCRRVKRPQKLTATKTKPMCVAEWRDSWLVFGDDGRIDLDDSIKNISLARGALLKTIGGDSI